MDRKKLSILLYAFVHAALAVCLGLAADIEIDDSNIDYYLHSGVLLINGADDYSIDKNEFNDDDLLTGLSGIHIEDNASLTLQPGTLLHLGEGEIIVRDGGTLIIYSVIGTGIYSSETPWDGDGDLQPDLPTILRMNGGTIEIKPGDTGLFYADTVHVALETGGGTIDIDSGIIFQSGAVSGAAGSIIKSGSGTWQVGTISMGGTLTLEEGTIVLLDWANIGHLNVHTGTTISGLNTDAERSNLTVTQGGTVNGTLEDIGWLISGTGTVNSTLTIEGGTHSMENLGIMLLSTVEIKDETTILLGPNEQNQDIIVDGTLKISSSATLSKIDSDMNSVPVRILLAGQTNYAASGTLEIERDPASPIFNLSDSEIKISHLGRIIVPDEITFQSGNVEYDPSVTAASLHVSGGGTFNPESINLGGGNLFIETTTLDADGNIDANNLFLHGATLITTGSLDVNDVTVEGTSTLTVSGTFQTNNITVTEGSTLNTAGMLYANRLSVESNAFFIAGGPSAFNSVDIQGKYDGGSRNLNILQSGTISGVITNIGQFSLADGASLTLVLPEETSPNLPIISAANWSGQNNNFTILVDDSIIIAQGVNIDRPVSYTGIISVTDGNTNTLLAKLQSSARTTALASHTWSATNPESMDLTVRVINVETYINNEWDSVSENQAAAARYIDMTVNAMEDENEGALHALRSLSPDGLNQVLRNAMTGELSANAVRLAMHNPAQSVFRHLDQVAPLHTPLIIPFVKGQSPNQMRGQVREGFNLWFNPYGEFETTKSDSISDGYDLRRYGFYAGGDIDIYNQAAAGLLFGYAAPYIKNDFEKITANDYTAGVYVRLVTAWEVALNAFVGFGRQEYKNAPTKFSGNAFYASAELSRPFYTFWTTRTAGPFAQVFSGPDPNYRLIPMVAFDYQSANVDPYTTSVLSLDDTTITTNKYDSMSVRVGLLAELWRFRTRVQYVRYVNSDDYVTAWMLYTPPITPGAPAPIPVSTEMRSVQWGRDWWNFGVGHELLATQRWRIFGEYNFDLGKRTQSHYCSISSVFSW